MDEETPENPIEPAAEAPTAPPVDEATEGKAAVESQPEPAAQPKLAGRFDYTRNLLAIEVPLTVTLASQRKSIREIIALGPGSIVKFNKTYGEPLDVAAGERIVAKGEVVKVGDKFGVRISGLVK